MELDRGDIIEETLPYTLDQIKKDLNEALDKFIESARIISRGKIDEALAKESEANLALIDVIVKAHRNNIGIYEFEDDLEVMIAQKNLKRVVDLQQVRREVIHFDSLQLASLTTNHRNQIQQTLLGIGKEPINSEVKRSHQVESVEPNELKLGAQMILETGAGNFTVLITDIGTEGPIGKVISERGKDRIGVVHKLSRYVTTGSKFCDMRLTISRISILPTLEEAKSLPAFHFSKEAWNKMGISDYVKTSYDPHMVFYGEVYEDGVGKNLLERVYDSEGQLLTEVKNVTAIPAGPNSNEILSIDGN